jgi:hypothetical protein
MPGIDLGRGLAVQRLIMNSPRLAERLGKLRFKVLVSFYQTLKWGFKKTVWFLSGTLAWLHFWSPAAALSR